MKKGAEVSVVETRAPCSWFHRFSMGAMMPLGWLRSRRRPAPKISGLFALRFLARDQADPRFLPYLDWRPSF